MKKVFTINLFAGLAALSLALLSGCTMYSHEIEDEAHTWRFVGLVDDSTALVSVSLEQWGETHDHHLMGYDDDFHWTKDAHYYPVKMNTYWQGKGREETPQTLPEKSETDDYGLRIEPLDDYSWACGIILTDRKGKGLDTLERPKCDSDSAKFVGSYVRVGNGFYLVEDGKFPKQKAAYTFEHTGYNIKFTDMNGDYIIYGGKP